MKEGRNFESKLSSYKNFQERAGMHKKIHILRGSAKSPMVLNYLLQEVTRKL